MVTASLRQRRPFPSRRADRKNERCEPANLGTIGLNPGVADILYVTTGLDIGGAETMLAQLILRLRERGHRQRVFSLTGAGIIARTLQSEGIDVTGLDVRTPLRGLAAAWHLAGEIRRMRPDVVQGWMYHGNLAALLAHRLAGRPSHTRVFWNLRASNIDLQRYGGILRWSARLSRMPDLIIANSKAGADFHLRQGFQPRRFEIVHNGIKTDTFRPDAALRSEVRARFGIASDAVVALHAARVDPMKDHATFLTAVQQVPEVTALLVGAGTEKLPLPLNARALGLRQDMDQLYVMADIVISSSAFGEGFSKDRKSVV